ncbi:MULTISPECIES: hypothetical protein [unclassified Sphingomonas]|uniref:WapI family immunity protein n=1 Tax=unclassified Sphingomonas TaxID=196159 RepID=UPI00226AAC7F|nr:MULTISPECIES: hypothetical protein [unclassified Sphingomonas]
MSDQPDLRFCGFSLWVDRRQFPNTSDDLDGNWLVVRARMEASGARVECEGPVLETTDIKRFREQLAAMVAVLSGEATLAGSEPEINIVLTLRKIGHVEGAIELTADHVNQEHRFAVEADQSYLPGLVQSCDSILERFPVIEAGSTAERMVW